MLKGLFASGLITILSSLALAQGAAPTTAAMLSQLDQDLNGCMIPSQQSIQTMLDQYATEVRSEQNLDISGHMRSWNLGIMGGILGNPASIMGGLVGLSAGHGEGSIQGTGVDIHADHPNLFVLTIFDNDAWATFDKQWRALSAQHPGLRIADGLRSILDWSSKASHQLANNYHEGELKKNLIRFNECRNDANALLGKLAFASRDAQKMLVISSQFERATRWADSVSINVFVLSTSNTMSPYTVNDAGGEVPTASNDAWAIGLHFAGNSDQGFHDQFTKSVGNVNQGNFTLDDGDWDIASYLIYSKTPSEPKRLSSDWKGF